MQIFDFQAYEAYCSDQQYRELNICNSCGGYGDHGYDDEGRAYLCYACCGDGKYFDKSAA